MSYLRHIISSNSRLVIQYYRTSLPGLIKKHGFFRTYSLFSLLVHKLFTILKFVVITKLYLHNCVKYVKTSGFILDLNIFYVEYNLDFFGKKIKFVVITFTKILGYIVTYLYIKFTSYDEYITFFIYLQYAAI